MPSATDSEKTIVIFRKWPDGEIQALFPEDPADTHGQTCSSYVHVGQHSGADYYACIYATRPATPEEYAALKAELEQRGYNLKVRQKASRKMHETRRQQRAI